MTSFKSTSSQRQCNTAGRRAEQSSQTRDDKREHGRGHGVAQTCAIERLHGEALSIFPSVLSVLSVVKTLIRSGFFLLPSSLSTRREVRGVLVPTVRVLRPGASRAATVIRRTTSRRRPAGDGRSIRRG